MNNYTATSQPYPNTPRSTEPVHAAVEQVTLEGGYRSAMLVHQPAHRRGLPVVILHGIQSHPAWFVGLADALAAAGHPVYQPTRRGSGINQDARGNARSVGQLLGDLDCLIANVLARESASRLHLVGISWGGKYAAAYALDDPRRDALAGLVLVAPGIVSKVRLPVCRQMAIAACAAVCPGRSFDIPLNEPELFTDQQKFRQYIAEDTHRLRRATARFLLVSRLMDHRINRAKPGSLGLPVRLLLATRDQIIDNEITRQRLERLAGPKLTVGCFEAAHTLEFMADARPYYNAVAAALAAQ